MSKYGVEISDEMSVELDVAPGAPVLRRVTLEWEVPGSELREALERFGGAAGRAAFAQTGSGVWVRVRVPLTRDGELFGRALLRIWSIAEAKLPDPHEVAAEEAERLGAAPGVVVGERASAGQREAGGG